MKNKRSNCIHLFSAMLLFCNVAVAQIPVSQEPHHKVVLENEYVRVLEGSIPFHDTTLSHVHAANSVIVFLSKSIFGIQVAGEAPVITDVNPGDTKYAAYGDKPVVHRVWNQSAPSFHFMVVELMKQHPGNDTCSIRSDSSVKFQWQQKPVCVYNLDIGEGKSLNLSKSNCAHLLIDISGNITASSAGSINTLQAGGFTFFSPQSNIQLDSKDQENVKCVLLELK